MILVASIVELWKCGGMPEKGSMVGYKLTWEVVEACFFSSTVLTTISLYQRCNNTESGEWEMVPDGCEAVVKFVVRFERVEFRV